MNYKRKSRRRFFLLMRSRTPPISSEFPGLGGGFEHPKTPSVRHCFMVTPCINNIQHFIYQLTHTTLKNVDLLKHSKTPVLLARTTEDSTDIFGIFWCRIHGFVWCGGLRAKSMTSQRYQATYKMADMRCYGNVMTTTRWRLYVILHLQKYSRRLNLFFLGGWGVFWTP